MTKIKHTKNELKRQKEDLERFNRFLPALILKKRQLQLEIIKILHAIEGLETKMMSLKRSVSEWVAVFAEDVNLHSLICIDDIKTSTGNIAGIDIPVFEDITFKEEDYDLIKTPLWVDSAIIAVKELAALTARLMKLNEQLVLVREGLRITTQRVSLFEKVKIPEARENIRRIRIFLGDMQTASVVTGKIAKRKIDEKMELSTI